MFFWTIWTIIVLNIYMKIFYFFFVSICLNDIHYYVLLQWAPALMGISPSGCLHCFCCANKLSLSYTLSEHRGSAPIVPTAWIRHCFTTTHQTVYRLHRTRS